MAEAIVGPLLSKLKDVAVTEAQALAAVGGEIETLSDKLMWLQALVHEADQQSRRDGSHLVRVLACQIREAAFEAEDAVDEFYLKGDLSRRFGLAQHFGRNWARAFEELVVNFRTHLCVRFTLTRRIQAMNARLEEIINNNSKYGLFQRSRGDGITWRACRAIPHVRDSWETSVAIEVRPKKTKELVDKLKEGSDGPSKVIRVVGVGGCGRRDLLMSAYEEKSIKEHFPVRVCVMSFPAGSDHMSIVETIRIKLGRDTSGSLAVDSRCLVVIYCPISMATWSKVEPMVLEMTGDGSKILLPGRPMDKNNGGSIVELGYLDETHSIRFFNRVYGLGGKTKYQVQQKDKIRNKIMEITNGLPLAVVLLAKLMRTMDLRKWGAASEYLMSNDEDTKLKTILSVSIDDLPDELKSCLLYTAGFPENRTIDAHQLVRLWMAEGFLTQQMGMGLEAEQLGQCYLKELIYRGLLLLVSKTSGADGGRVEKVAFHDQIHQLLRLEAQHSRFMDFHYGGHVPPPANTRRLALYMNSDKFSAPSSYLDKLRTALFFSDEATSSSTEVTTLMRTLLQGSPFLRVMDLEEGPSDVSELPNEIEEFLHLQYLRVPWGSLKTVPSSIGNLRKLQTLDVRGTKVTELPESLWKTKTLRHILGDGLIFPRSAGELKHLQTLETVTIHNNQEGLWWCLPGSEQTDLRFLHRLGIIKMDECERQDLELEAVLMDLGYHLESLSLSGNTIRMDLLAAVAAGAGASASAGGTVPVPVPVLVPVPVPVPVPVLVLMPVPVLVPVPGAGAGAGAGARLRHVASLELNGKLQPPNSFPHQHLSNLTRLVLLRTKVGQEFIHDVSKLPILAELEMQNESYDGTEVTFWGCHGFSGLSVLRITLGTLTRVVTLHPADSRRNKAIEPIFMDMDIAKTGNDIVPLNNTSHCNSCNVALVVQTYVLQHPSAA